MFYAPNLFFDNTLPEEESLHAIKVLRLGLGDEIELVDGKGTRCKAKITNPHFKRCEFEIIEQITLYRQRDYHLHIAIAPTKNIERFEWFVEKATEIGIDEITPLLCRFSERKIIKPERLEKIIVAASKQSQQAYFPLLNPIIPFPDFVESITAEQKFIAHCYNAPKKSLQQACQPHLDTLILIGPEGDFSTEEVAFALNNQFQAISLGDTRLRTETAGIIATHTVVLKNS